MPPWPKRQTLLLHPFDRMCHIALVQNPTNSRARRSNRSRCSCRLDCVHVVNRLGRGMDRSNDIPRHRDRRRWRLYRHDVGRLFARAYRDRRRRECCQARYFAGDGDSNWRSRGCDGRCGPLVCIGLCNEKRLRIGGSRRQRESRGSLLQQTLAICFPAE
jgi:hypothetical protein